MQGMPLGNTHAGTARHQLADGVEQPALYQMEMPISNTAQCLGNRKEQKPVQRGFFFLVHRSCEALQEEQ